VAREAGVLITLTACWLSTALAGQALRKAVKETLQ
jgi:hypothetical protein